MRRHFIAVIIIILAGAAGASAQTLHPGQELPLHGVPVKRQIAPSS